MLSQENNELLTRTGPGTPMGEFMRRYWIPALLSEEIPECDGTPVRVSILGEKLVAFRDTNGNIGLMDEFCPHRGVSLVYGRNEKCGIHCIYHGWKLDVNGNIVETPSEHGDSAFIGKLKQQAYPVREAGGVIWAYMGPSEHMPPFPEFEWTRLPKSQVYVKKVLLECNYLQSIEGGIDSAHISFLHSSELKVGHVAMATQDTAPKLEVQDTDYGFRYAALRNKDADHQYVRITPFIMPFHTIVPFADHQPQAQHAWVPMDDEHNWAFTFTYMRYGPLEPYQSTHPYDLAGKYTKARSLANNHLQDREAMKSGSSYSGIVNIADQDAAIQESMGPIVNRTKEHLGKSDIAVIHMRRLMLKNLQEFGDGQAPLGTSSGVSYHLVRSEVDITLKDKPWKDIGYSSGQ